MNESAQIKFKVDEEYKNEKGVFKVISMHRGHMVIRWENGEEIRLELTCRNALRHAGSGKKTTAWPRPKSPLTLPSSPPGKNPPSPVLSRRTSKKMSRGRRGAPAINWERP